MMNRRILCLLLLVSSLFLVTSNAQTRGIVPRADGEGTIGTSSKSWGSVYAKSYWLNGLPLSNWYKGTNGISAFTNEFGSYIGLSMPTESGPQLLGYDGTNIVWRGNLPASGTTVTSILSRTVITNFQQNSQVDVDGVVLGVYDNSKLSNDVSQIDFNSVNESQFNNEEISGFNTFIVSTNGYFGKFTNSISGTKLQAGCSLYINNKDYAIVKIIGNGTNDLAVQLQYDLPVSTTQVITNIRGVIYKNLLTQMSYAFDSLTTNRIIVSSDTSINSDTWCCSDDGQIQYYIATKICYKSTDGGKSFYPIVNIDYTFGNNTTCWKMYTRDGTNVWFWIWDTVVATSYPIYLSTNGMRSYADAGYPVNQYSDLVTASTNIIMVTDRNDSHIRISTNNGVTWSATNTVVGARAYNAISCSSNGQVIAVSPYSGPYARQYYVSTNAGVTWYTNLTSLNYPHTLYVTPDGSSILSSSGNGDYIAGPSYYEKFNVPSTNRIYGIYDLDGMRNCGLKIVNYTNLYYANICRIYKQNVNLDGITEKTETLVGKEYSVNMPYRDRIANLGSAYYSSMRLSINPVYPNVWYIKSSSSGYTYYDYLWASTDYGQTYYRIKSDQQFVSYQPPVSNGQIMLWPYWVSGTPNTYPDLNHSIFKSDDFGRSMYSLNGQRGCYQFLSMPTTNIIYANLYNDNGNSLTYNYIVKSTDGGIRFYLMGGMGTRQNLENISAASFNGKTNIIVRPGYTVDNAMINEDESNSNTWTMMDIPNTGGNRLRVIQNSNDSGWIFMPYSGDIYYYENIFKFNRNFYKINSLGNIYPNSFFEQHLQIYKDNTVTNFYMGIYAVTNIFISSNNFSSVSTFTNSPKCRWGPFDTHDGKIIWACGSTNTAVATLQAHAFVSTNGGLDWTNKTIAAFGAINPSTSYIQIWSVDGTNVYINYNSRFYKTTNMGTTWIPLFGGITYPVTSMSGDRNNRTVGGKMWLTTAAFVRGQHNAWVTTNEFTTIDSYMGEHGVPEAGLSYYTDHWGPIVSPPGQPDRVYIGKRDGYLYQSNDGGTNWIRTDLSCDGLSRDWLISANGDTVYAVRVFPYITSLDMYTSVNYAEIFVSYGNETPNPMNPNARVFNRKYINGDDIPNRPLAIRGIQFIGDTLYLDNGYSYYTYKDDGTVIVTPSNNFTIATKSGIDAKNWATINGMSVSDLYTPTYGSYVSYLMSFDSGNTYMKYENTNWVCVVTNNIGTNYYRYLGAYLAGTTNILETISLANNHIYNRFLNSDISKVGESDWLKPNGFSETTTNILISATFIPSTTNYYNITRAPILYNTKIGSTYNSDVFTRKDTNYNVIAIGTNTMQNTIKRISGNISDAIIYYMKGL